MKTHLVTLHAKYAHASLALPTLMAACAGLPGVACTSEEFTVNERTDGILRRLVATETDIMAFSCYIWNIEQTLKLAADLKLIRPETFIILGGPEVSYGAFELMAQHPAIDCIVRGEGETTLKELLALLASTYPGPMTEEALTAITGLCCRRDDGIVTTGDREPATNLDAFPSPFAAGLVRLDKPLVYYETSRGCPFSCAFCMSSLEKQVRSYSLTRIRQDLTCLLAQKPQTIKLVDRTFNFDGPRANTIWEFILDHNQGSCFHFEIAADLLTDANLELLRRVPAGWFRFEIGVQSTLTDTLDQVGRKTDLRRLFAMVERLRTETAVTLHLDLVAGLPGEDFAGFLASLQRLLDARPHHIQVEVLKVLKGAPMRRIAREQGYAYSATPPYRTHHTPWLSFRDIVRIENLAELLEKFYNSGRFSATLTALAEQLPLADFFADLANHWETTPPPETSRLAALYHFLWQFMEHRGPAAALPLLRDALCFDYCLAGHPGAGLPPFLFDQMPPRAGLTTPEIARQLNLPPSCRFKSFTARFLRDYRSLPWQEGPLALTFVYVPTPDQGQQVRILTPPPTPDKSENC